MESVYVAASPSKTSGPFMLSDLPRNHFGAILIDPPWRFETWSDNGKDRSADNHYDTMTLDEIAMLQVAAVAAKNCVLFTWGTWPMLPQVLTVIDHWCFKFKTCAFCWTKADGQQLDMWSDTIEPSIGNGYWTRANTEYCLLATRGKPQRIGSDVRQAIVEPAREHSRKPDCIHERIERLVDGPYLEIFARQQVEGWSCVGNEISKFPERKQQIAGIIP